MMSANIINIDMSFSPRTVDYLYLIVDSILVILFILVMVAFYTLAERKFMASIQRRRGPNVVGPYGLLQPIADAIKLLAKEIIIPHRSNKFLFLFAPVYFLTISLTAWSVVPITPDTALSDHMYSLLIVYALSTMSVIGVILAGWSSNSKYSLLGALRSAAQMISYEVSLGFIFAIVAVSAGSWNIIQIVESQKQGWFLFPLLPLVLIFLISILAETNRAPFDLPEAEAELVAGYNLEYSGITFAMFFLAEYANMLLMSILGVHLFLGGWYVFGYSGSAEDFQPSVTLIMFKLMLFSMFFVWVRASLPRYRYDQLMDIGWKIFLPFTLGYFFYVIGLLYYFDCFIDNSLYDSYHDREFVKTMVDNFFDDD